MTINWYGGGCYKIQTPNFNLVIDPETAASAGSRLKADLILHTTLEVGEIGGDDFPPKEEEIFGPGEYNLGPARIKGVLVSKESKGKLLKTAYSVVLEDLRLGFLGDIAADLTEDELDSLDGIDILFVPASAASSLRYVKAIEPKWAIPAGDAKKLASELGEEALPQEKFTIKKKDLGSEEKTKLAVLSY